MKMDDFELTATFGFESAHFSRARHAQPAERRLHGHSYRCRVTIAGPVGRDGMVVDQGKFQVALGRIREALDHRLLNEIEGLTNATIEGIAQFVRDRFSAELTAMRTKNPRVRLVAVEVKRPSLGVKCRLGVRS